MSYLLGIDVGTTGVKAALFSADGKPLGSSVEEYSLITAESGFVELDAETYWTACKKAIEKAVAEAEIDPENIEALSISSQGETLIALDSEGRPLRRAIVWLDNRSKEESLYLRKRFGENEVYKVTGQPRIVPTWPATKILWLRKKEPQTFEKTHKFLLVEDYLIYKFTGKFFTEPSICSSTLLLDIRKKNWWNDMLDELGITPDKLPTLERSGKVIDELSRDAATQTRLSKKTKVVTGAFDQAASAIGAGNISPGTLSETTGAALAMVATVEKPVYDPKLRIPCHVHVIDDLYFLMPWCQTAGMLLKWFRDAFCTEEKIVENLTNIEAYKLMDKEAEKVPPGSEGLVILPHLMGAACPEFDPYASCVMFGVTLKHSKSHFIRAVMEAVAYMLRRNVEVLEELGIEVREIRSIGGAAKSGLWARIKSDALQKKILIPKIKDTATLGAAILAGVAAGIYSSLKSAVESMISIEEEIEPDPRNQEVYASAYEVYKRLYDALRPVFRLHAGKI